MRRDTLGSLEGTRDAARIIAEDAAGSTGSGWSIRPLGELVDNFDALRVPVKEADRKPGPYPYYGASGIVDWVDDFIFDGEYVLVAEDGENLRTRKTPVAFLADGKFWVNNHAHIIRGNGEADTRFLLYALNHAGIGGFLARSTMPKLTQGNLHRIPLLVPNLAEQHAIAHVLGTLDDKIELNRRMNQTLEEIARALFRSWFVDFDPVYATAAGRQPEGMDAETAALFPDSFEDSELGPMPKGWPIGRLDDLFVLQRGFDLPTRDRVEGRVPIISSSGVTGYHNEARVEPTGVVTGRYGTLGEVYYIDQQFWPLNTALYVRDFKGNGAAFVYFLLRSLDFKAYSDKRSVPGLNRNHLHSMRLVIPASGAICTFSGIGTNLLKKISSNNEQGEMLRSIRDALLPNLLSGEIRVPEVELQLAEVGV